MRDNLLDQTVRIIGPRLKEKDAEIERLAKCCTQRGAREQLLKEFMESRTTNGVDSMWTIYCKINPDAKSWFDGDGVPVRKESDT